MTASLSIPLDLPGNSFIQQLEWLECWACLAPGTLSNNRTALGDKWDARDGMTPIILECVKNKAWNWPAYKDFIAQGGYQLSDNLVTDMAEQVYNKFRSNRYALYRKHQIDGLKEFRPFWQLVGQCAESGRRTYLADDDYWEKGCAPWNCTKLKCDCRVDSLSRIELAHYVEKGCENDPTAIELLKTWGWK